jgi:hypothetical protein
VEVESQSDATAHPVQLHPEESRSGVQESEAEAQSGVQACPHLANPEESRSGVPDTLEYRSDVMAHPEQLHQVESQSDGPELVESDVILLEVDHLEQSDVLDTPVKAESKGESAHRDQG